MNKIMGFMDSLKKSTKITMLSCGSFVVLTVLILAFFIMFPITPSEKIMSNIGRENISQDDGGDPSVQSGVPGVETTSVVSSVKTTSVNTKTTTAHTSFTITITTGSGFMWNGRIPTGGYEGDYGTQTTPVDPEEPYPGEYPNTDPGNPDHPYDPGTEIPDPTTGNIDPTTGGGNDPEPGPGNSDPNTGGGDGGSDTGGDSGEE